MDVDAEIENTVKRVAIVVTLVASHSGAQFSTKNLVYPGCLRKLGVDLSAVKKSGHGTNFRRTTITLTTNAPRDKTSVRRL